MYAKVFKTAVTPPRGVGKRVSTSRVVNSRPTSKRSLVTAASRRTNWIALHTLGIALIVALAATPAFAQKPRRTGAAANPTADVGPLENPSAADGTQPDQIELDQGFSPVLYQKPAWSDDSGEGPQVTSLDGGKSLPPQGDYVYETGLSFSYTYYASFSLTAGQSVTFTTQWDPPTGSDPVMYLFHSTDPVGKGSWSDDDSGGGYQSKITCTPAHTGTYMLLIRSYSGAAQKTNVYKNTTLVASNVPIAGTKVSCSSLSKTGELNYFTCKSSGDPRIWLVDNSSAIGLVRAYNDDYAGSGAWAWGNNARVKKSFSNQISYVVLSAYSSSTTGACDIYMKCNNGTLV